jgi:hypothetical protein
VRISSLAKIMIGVENIVVEDVSFDEDAQAIVIDAKALQAPLLQMRQVRAEGPLLRCRQGNQALEMPRCRRDEGVYPGGCIQGEVPKMRYCAVRKLPWADHRSWLTRAFEDSCCWLVLLVSKPACQKLLRIL